MKFKIHRGTKEIGGSCVEVWTNNARILIDFGLPLNQKLDLSLSKKELIKQGILPNIKELYGNSKNSFDGIIISHAHQDHFGLITFVNEKIPLYLGEATYKIIEINNLFTRQNINIKKKFFFENEKTFNIGDISITPYWADHSAFDSYSFLIEAEGKSLFYSGDFRAHGRKSKIFYRFLHNAPKNVDYLLLEGTTISRTKKRFPTEENIEKELVAIFNGNNKINLIYVSGQNIDRIISIYKACLKTGKIMVVDVYVALVLKTLSEFAKLPFASKNFKDIKVFYSRRISNKLSNDGNENILFRFKHYKIKKEEISKNPGNIVMLVRPSMQDDLEKISGIDGGNIIYSMWEGYLQDSATKKFIDYLVKKRKFTLHKIHTSGHADTETLKKLVNAIKPKSIVPIHTFDADKYKNIFNAPITQLNDGEEREV